MGSGALFLLSGPSAEQIRRHGESCKCPRPAGEQGECRGLRIRGSRRVASMLGACSEVVPRLPDPPPCLVPLPQNYIQELRNCSSKEQEKERVDKELGKIRKKYTSDKAMSSELAWAGLAWGREGREKYRHRPWHRLGWGCVLQGLHVDACSGAGWSQSPPQNPVRRGTSAPRPAALVTPAGPLPAHAMPRAAYDKRKYMWKLLYTHMLGYDVDFGHKQAMDLIAATGCVRRAWGRGMGAEDGARRAAAVAPWRPLDAPALLQICREAGRLRGLCHLPQRGASAGFW